ncbi:hypothetical protein [Qiania dongpingensis]|uniref:Fluoroquinolone transport system permease protein n=1 Tax=Qiania dongpingensis TaxID=2763669 RepID=A0A7G9G643_9FIRM|nr:hypothetical protein [Qiania dongpingensis]QNM06275.1 hypothetical protein H9Q78_03775 [Qiania dongpingensis]
MKQTMRLFKIGLKQISKDGMLIVLIPAPFLAGVFFKFVIPFLNHILTAKYQFSIIAWYGLADGMMICLTPIFTAIISAFLLLEERDEGLSAFYQITPAEGYSYLSARIGIPMIWAFAATITVSFLLNLSSLSLQIIFLSSIISSLTGISLAMMVASIAGNRVEGLALSKMMGLSFMGLILVWFVPAPYHYFMAFLPSFWIGKLLADGADFFMFLLGVLTSFIWIALFTRRFLKRV